jgi:hypothetical protein
MEKIFGPFDGYVAVVSVREASGFENKFAASYELWRGAPAVDDANARPVRQKSVAGLSQSVDEAVDIALQLARIHIAGLPASGGCLVTPHVDATSRLAQFAKSWEEAESQRDFVTYQPTMACPLQ